MRLFIFIVGLVLTAAMAEQFNEGGGEGIDLREFYLLQLLLGLTALALVVESVATVVETREEQRTERTRLEHEGEVELDDSDTTAVVPAGSSWAHDGKPLDPNAVKLLKNLPDAHPRPEHELNRTWSTRPEIPKEALVHPPAPTGPEADEPGERKVDASVSTCVWCPNGTPLPKHHPNGQRPHKDADA